MKKPTEDKSILSGHSIDIKSLKEIKDGLVEENIVKSLSSIFKALGDPTRIKIIYVLSKTPLCVCDIATILDMTQSAISHHLRLLRDLQLVKFKKDGKLVIYSLDDEHVLKLFMEGLEHVSHL